MQRWHQSNIQYQYCIVPKFSKMVHLWRIRIQILNHVTNSKIGFGTEIHFWNWKCQHIKSNYMKRNQFSSLLESSFFICILLYLLGLDFCVTVKCNCKMWRLLITLVCGRYDGDLKCVRLCVGCWELESVSAMIVGSMCFLEIE